LRISLRSKLLIAFLLPVVLLLGVQFYISYNLLAFILEDELGRRLSTTAAAIASQRGLSLASNLAPGDENTRTYMRLKKKLQTAQKATGAKRIYIFDANLKCLVDSNGEFKIGEKIYKLEADRLEIQQARLNGKSASVLFEGKDGRLYKSGYAKIPDAGDLFLGVDGSAAFFTNVHLLTKYLALVDIATLLSLIVASFFISRRLSRRLYLLVDAARRIGAGKLEEPVAVEGSDELAFLANTMEEMRAQLEERDRTMQVMLAGIAHEIKNPLGGIELFSGLLAEELADQPELKKKVESIRRELRSLEKTVDDFLAFSRKRPLTIEEIDLNELVQEVAFILSADFQNAEISFETDIPESISISADRGGLKRVLMNLVKNAVQAVDKKGVVKIIVRRDGEGVLIRVQDNGRGMTEEQLKEATKPFYTTREKGSGLGLALVKKVVDQHGGELKIESTLGKGTTVDVRLPKSPPNL